MSNPNPNQNKKPEVKKESESGEQKSKADLRRERKAIQVNLNRVKNRISLSNLIRNFKRKSNELKKQLLQKLKQRKINKLHK